MSYIQHSLDELTDLLLRSRRLLPGETIEVGDQFLFDLDYDRRLIVTVESDSPTRAGTVLVEGELVIRKRAETDLELLQELFKRRGIDANRFDLQGHQVSYLELRSGARGIVGRGDQSADLRFDAQGQLQGVELEVDL
jgi:hypothetical protein